MTGLVYVPPIDPMLDKEVVPPERSPLLSFPALPKACTEMIQITALHDAHAREVFVGN